MVEIVELIRERGHGLKQFVEGDNKCFEQLALIRSNWQTGG